MPGKRIQEHVRLWVKDLRSGFFSQTNGTLRDSKGHCCLGVAGCTYQEYTDEGWWSGSTFHTGTGEHLDGSLENEDEERPSIVAEWLGLDPEIERKLMTLNDGGKSFDEIALYIERRVFEGLTHHQAMRQLKQDTAQLKKLEAELKQPSAEEPQQVEQEQVLA